MSETPDLSKPRLPHTVVGAASPLWGYFAGAAMGGVAFWWMTQFAQGARIVAGEARSFQPLMPDETLQPIAAPTAEEELATAAAANEIEAAAEEAESIVPFVPTAAILAEPESASDAESPEDA